ncbi:MAG: PmoA family protein, partial [Planctomycetota bacterium]|nr:PmoA family protein [Planctomycetota bacterium]
GDKTIGVAVVDHPDNPPTLWHNHRGVRMLNPCNVAPAEVTLKAAEPLVLRYRVLTFDGEIPAVQVKRLAEEFRRK